MMIRKLLIKIFKLEMIEKLLLGDNENDRK